MTGEYFRTLQIRPECSRLLTQTDLDEAEANPVCVISYRFWQNELQSSPDVVGRTIRLNTRPYKIVGVSEHGFSGVDLQRPVDLQIPATRVADYMPAFVCMPRFDWKSRLYLFSAIARLGPHASRASASAQLTRLHVYQDAGQLLTSGLTVFVRCHGPCTPLLPTLRAAITRVDPNTPILGLNTVQTELEGTFSSEEVLGFLSTLFAALAMLLVGAGIYGVLSYALTRRTREVGIRMALGATAKDIVDLFVSEATGMIVLGTLIGVPAALAAVTLLRSQLFGVAPQDPATLAACILCVVVTILLASIAPIRRALHISPQQALRME